MWSCEPFHVIQSNFCYYRRNTEHIKNKQITLPNRLHWTQMLSSFVLLQLTTKTKDNGFCFRDINPSETKKCRRAWQHQNFENWEDGKGSRPEKGKFKMCSGKSWKPIWFIWWNPKSSGVDSTKYPWRGIKRDRLAKIRRMNWKLTKKQLDPQILHSTSWMTEPPHSGRKLEVYSL